jgi:hypothetical protein
VPKIAMPNSSLPKACVVRTEANSRQTDIRSVHTVMTASKPPVPAAVGLARVNASNACAPHCRPGRMQGHAGLGLPNMAHCGARHAEEMVAEMHNSSAQVHDNGAQS